MANKIAALPMLREDPNTSIIRLDKCQAKITKGADLRSFYSRKSNLTEILEHISDTVEKRKSKVISFDVFDTALLREIKSEARRFWESSELFLETTLQNNKHKKNLTLKALKPEDVFLARILSAKAAYAISPTQNGNREGIFGNIAKSTCELLGIPELTSDYICSEIAYESKSLVPSSLLLAIKSEHPKISIIFISDMYLEGHQISEIVKNKLPSHKKPIVFSSADGLGSKREGQLYTNVMRSLNIEPREMIHIGDNLGSDYRQAKRLGIEAIYLPIPTVEQLHRRDCYNSLCTELIQHKINLKTTIHFNY